MFNPTLNNTDNKFRSTATIMAIAKPLALMAVLLSVSPAASARRNCNEEEQSTGAAACDSFRTGWGLDHCTVNNSGDDMFLRCCDPSGAICAEGGWPGDIWGIDEDTPIDDDYRGEPTDPSSTPDDADELVDEEPGFSDDDGDIRGADDGDTDPDERLEIGACCVDLACIDDLTEDECEYEELGAWFASMDCADTVTECAAVDPDPTGDDEDELVDEEPGFSDDDDDGDTGDDGFDIGDADDTSTDDEDASVDDDDTQADGDVDTEPEVSDTSAGCSTVGQAGGGLMALILGALLGLTRRQVRWS